VTGRTITLLAVAAAMLAACTAENSPTEPTTPTSSTGGHGSYAQCLTEHGAPAAPGPVAGPPPGVDQQTWQQAVQACAELAPGPA
jgi:outer membrane biogenesis lipoprotein LolB